MKMPDAAMTIPRLNVRKSVGKPHVWQLLTCISLETMAKPTSSACISASVDLINARDTRSPETRFSF